MRGIYILETVYQNLTSEFIVHIFHHAPYSDLYSAVFTEQSYILE